MNCLSCFRNQRENFIAISQNITKLNGAIFQIILDFCTMRCFDVDARSSLSSVDGAFDDRTLLHVLEILWHRAAYFSPVLQKYIFGSARNQTVRFFGRTLTLVEMFRTNRRKFFEFLDEFRDAVTLRHLVGRRDVDGWRRRRQI